MQAFKNPSSYTLLVDKTLTQCRESKLKKFHVRSHYDIRFESLFNKWIRYAISCNVEELYLDFSRAEFRLDPSLFINSHLTYLTLFGCILNPIGAISWPNLRSLGISHMNLDDDFILNILSGSPLLETVVINSDYDADSDSESEANMININAPNTLWPTQCPQLKFKKFEVLCYKPNRFKSQLSSWIRYAIRFNVKEFIIKICLNTEYGSKLRLDQIVFTSSCFTKMELYGCKIKPVGAISWNNLRSLCISSQSLNEKLIENILSGSPVLESLELDDCGGYKRLDITSKSVKNLVISGYCNHNEKTEIDTIEVNAPNILSLTIQGNISLWKFLLVHVKCLVKAKLNYWCAKRDRHKTLKNTKEEILKGYIMSLAHVKELQVGCDCSMAVLNLQAQGFAFPSNVKFHNSISFLKEYLGWWK